MKSDPEPEILVPPDMENLEIEEPSMKGGFPFKRFTIMILLTLLLIGVAGTGISVYLKTEKIAEVIPYWIFAVLLLTPTACSYYFFFIFFKPRLRNPYEWSDNL